MFKVVVFVTVVLVQTSLCQWNGRPGGGQFQQADVGPCNGRWRSQVGCLKNRVRDRAKNDPQFPMPDQWRQNDIKRAVANCFKQQGCFDSPVPTDQETNARRDCFKKAKRQLNQQLNRCIDSSRVRGYDPVDDSADMELDEWGFTVRQIFDGLRNPREYCGQSSGRNSESLRRCVQQAAYDKNFNYDFTRRPPRNMPNYWCEEDARCWSETTMQCQDQWDRIQPTLCDCAKELGVDRYIAQAADTYRQCLGNRVRNEEFPDEDPGVLWLTEYVKDLCVTSNNHPCRSQRRRYDNRRG